MRYLHTMLRVANLEKSLYFYCNTLGFTLVKKRDYPEGKFTLAFLRAPAEAGDASNTSPLLELTYNWGSHTYVRGDAFGHLAYSVPSVEAIQTRLRAHGFDLSWGPGKTPDGTRQMAFIDDPDGYEIELLETD